MSRPPKVIVKQDYVGAPEKLNDALQADLCRFLRIGARPQQACAMVGITVATFYVWLKQGAPGTAPSKYRTFNLAVAKAMSEHELGALARLTQAAQGVKGRAATADEPAVEHIPPEPKWDAWILEHVYAKRYNKQHVEVTGEGGAPIETVSHVGTDTATRLSSIVARARARIAIRDGESDPNGGDDTGGASGAGKPIK